MSKKLKSLKGCSFVIISYKIRENAYTSEAFEYSAFLQISGDIYFGVPLIDPNIVVDELFDLMKGEWKKNAERAIILLCSRKKYHVVIAKTLKTMINNFDLLADNVNILSNLMLIESSLLYIIIYIILAFVLAYSI